MDKISKEIEEMAEKMEKSVTDPKEKLEAVIKSLGKDGLKAKMTTLSDDEKLVLKAALEEMTLKKAVSFDDAYAAKFVQGNIKDTIIQEDTADDDQDEKLVKPSAAKIDHQGTPTEGWSGQVIKASEMSDEEVDSMIKGYESLTSEYSDDFEKAYEGFSKLKNKLSGEKGVQDPAGLAAAIGRKKYGKGKFQHAASEGKKMKKSDIEDNLDLVIEKAMEKCNDDKMVMKKLKEKGMDESKVQGALDKYKAKKDMKKSEDDIEKGKMKAKMDEDEAKNKLMAMEEKEHGTKNPKKLVEAEKKEHMKKAVQKEIEPSETDQSGGAPDLEHGGKTMGKKTSAPDIEDNAKANKKNTTAPNVGKIKKSVSWEGEDRLLKANTGGRNFHFNVERFITETIAGESQETITKSSSETKEDLNDLIAKGKDMGWDKIKGKKDADDAEKKKNGKMVKSFNDEELAEAMGMTVEQMNKILG